MQQLKHFLVMITITSQVELFSKVVTREITCMLLSAAITTIAGIIIIVCEITSTQL